MGRVWWAIPLVFALAIGARLIHLGADPQPDYIPKDEGYLADEGYKTLSPRNLVLFGSTHWHAADEYTGWMKASPLTQWPFYAAFSALGVDRINARYVVVAFFSLFLLAVALYFRGRYAAGIALLGMLLMATDPMLFQFSRVAFFEIPLIAVVYSGILLAAVPRRASYALVVLLSTAAVAMYGVKASAYLYLAPPIVAVLVEVASRRRLSPKHCLVPVVAVAAVAALFSLKAHHWIVRSDWLEPFRKADALLLNPSYQLSPLAMVLGYAVLIDVALRRGLQAFTANRLLLMTGSLVLAVPAVLAFVPDNPPRYYAAAIPAALLSCAEWFRLRRAGALDDPYRYTAWRVAFAIALLPLLCGSLLGFIGTYLAGIMPFLPQGTQSGLTTRTLIKLYPLAAVAFALAIWLAYRRGRLALDKALPLGVAVQLLFAVQFIAQVLTHPSYMLHEIGRQLESVVAPGESVAGDWAPVIALDTPIPALYVERGLNDGPQIDVLRPTFFLNSHTPRDLDVLQQLRIERAAGHEALFLGTLFGRRIELLRLAYASERSATSTLPRAGSDRPETLE